MSCWHAPESEQLAIQLVQSTAVAEAVGALCSFQELP